ncbi:MAG: hypothetical protein CMB02_02205 [Euryarchaeota archaeon]|nr:hypothetical protein [Euryarchaeota archaeon]
MPADPFLSTLRISMIFSCMFIAARSDFQTLSVRDMHWKIWAIPATIILVFETASTNSGFANLLTISAMIAVFSTCFYRIPELRSFRDWQREQVTLSLIYLIGIAGIFLGGIEYSDTDFVNLILGEESNETMLWWGSLGAILTMVLYLSAWKARIIPGGADVKALILVTLFFPSWAFIPEQMYFSGENTFRIPPSMALFLWAGASFIIAAPIIFLSNVARGDVSTAPDFKMAWHATKKPVSRIIAGPSWILTEVAGTEDEPRVVNRILPSNPSSSGSIQEELERLESMGVEEAWVATKHPFLVYLFFALFPLLLLGDPLAYLLK